MTTTLEAPETTRRGQPLLLSALVAAAIVTACVLFERYWTFHAIPSAFRHVHGVPLDVWQFVALLVPYAVLALALAVWGIDARHRLAGAVAAVGTGLVAWGFVEVLQRYLFDHGHMTQRVLQIYDWTFTLAIPTLLALAWGLARRRGRAWVLGVAVAPLLAALHHHYYGQHWWQDWEFRHGSWWVLRLEFLAPAIVAGLVCWLLENAPRNRSSA
jgi:hypothetical protein